MGVMEGEQEPAVTVCTVCNAPISDDRFVHETVEPWACSVECTLQAALLARQQVLSARSELYEDGVSAVGMLERTMLEEAMLEELTRPSRLLRTRADCEGLGLNPELAPALLALSERARGVGEVVCLNGGFFAVWPSGTVAQVPVLEAESGFRRVDGGWEAISDGSQVSDAELSGIAPER